MAQCPPLRFPRVARILRAHDFAALKRCGKSLAVQYFHAQYRINTSVDTARLGIAVARRVSKRAVVRNGIKRQLRESFRCQRPYLPNIDILVIARPTAAQQSPISLREDLKILWRRIAGLKREDSPGTMRAIS